MITTIPNYGIIYKGSFTPKGGLNHHAYILKKNYTGPDKNIKLTNISYDFSDVDIEKNQYISSSSVKLSFINLPDFWEIFELYRTVEKEYVLVLEIEPTEDSTSLVFVGYMVQDVMTQGYLNRATINLYFSDYLQKMNTFRPSTLSTNNYSKLGEVIKDAISICVPDFSGLKILEYTTLYETVFDQTESSLMQSLVSSEIFFEDAVKVKDFGTIMNMICTTFQIIVYYIQGTFLVIRWVDLGGVNETITSYTYNFKTLREGTGTFDPVFKKLYDPDSAGNGEKFKFLNQSQQWTSTPGLGSFEITCDLKQYNSLTTNYFGNIASNNHFATSDPFRGIYHEWRTWYWNYPHATTVTPIASTRYLSSGCLVYYGATGNASIDLQHDMYRGVVTRFLTTLDPVRSNNLHITFGCYPDTFYRDSIAKLYTLISTKFRVCLMKKQNRSLDGVEYVYLDKTSPNEKDWVYRSEATEGIYTHILETDFIPLDDFTDPDEVYHEVAFDINLDTIKAAMNNGHGLVEKTNWEFDIMIMSPINKTRNIDYIGVGSLETNNYSRFFSFGDVLVTAEAEKQNNYIVAKSSEGYSNSSKVDLSIFDCIDVNYSNGVFYEVENEGLLHRTKSWTDKYHPTTGVDLVSHLVHSRFSYLGRTTLSLSGTIRCENQQDYYRMMLSSIYVPVDGVNTRFIITQLNIDLGNNTAKIKAREYVDSSGLQIQNN